MRLPRKLFLVLLSVVMSVLITTGTAQAVVIDFDGLAEFDEVTTQFSGLTFTNTEIWTAGGFLDENEYPPHSGDNVAVPMLGVGAIFIEFDPLVTYVGGFFTYFDALSMTAFDLLGDDAGEALSLYDSNYVSSGYPPNEFLSISFPGGIKSLEIYTDTFAFFTLDDLTFTPVPEPSTLLILAAGLAALGARDWRRTRRK